MKSLIIYCKSNYFCEIYFCDILEEEKFSKINLSKHLLIDLLSIVKFYSPQKYIAAKMSLKTKSRKLMAAKIS